MFLLLNWEKEYMSDEIREKICKDLAPRIFSGLQVVYEGKVYNVEAINEYYEVQLEGENYTLDIEQTKPILRKMSDMTKQEKTFFDKWERFEHGWKIDFAQKISWLTDNMFDYNEILKYYE